MFDEDIFRALESVAGLFHDMQVDFCCFDTVMAEELLDCADVLPPFQQVCRKGVTEGVATGSLAHSGIHLGTLHGLLHHARIQMMTALVACFPVAPAILLRKHPLPAPLPTRPLSSSSPPRRHDRRGLVRCQQWEGVGTFILRVLWAKAGQLESLEMNVWVWRLR